MDPTDFRTNTLTILGAVAFIAALVLWMLRATGEPVSYGAIFGLLGLASVLLGVDLTGLNGSRGQKPN